MTGWKRLAEARYPIPHCLNRWKRPSRFEAGHSRQFGQTKALRKPAARQKRQPETAATYGLCSLEDCSLLRSLLSVIKVCSGAHVLSAIANIACMVSAPRKQRFRRNSNEVALQAFPGAYRYEFRRAINSSLQLRIKPLERFYLLKGKQLVSTRRDVSEDKQTVLTGVGDAI